ncbi:hypothetical protein SAMN05444276_101814 [Paracoccus sanguinis]|uniref:Uncharacterized protein n=1 Tax=Paracoccus sanguinis TaxID=1545044 RepID=A0A1H2T1R2_9RHOB|nr:hypothetical protein SAMN05444276_101814 [Paracoccus sanguinis]
MPQGRAAHADVRGRWARPCGRAQGPGAGAPVRCRARGRGGEPPSGRPQPLFAPPRAPRCKALGRRFSRPPRTPYGDPGAPPPYARGPDAAGDSVPGPAPTVPSRRSLRRRTPCRPPRDAAHLGLDTNIPAGGIPQCHPRCPGAGRRAQTLPARRAPQPTAAAGRQPHTAGATSASARRIPNSAKPDARAHATGGTSTTGTPARALTACATEPSTRSMARSRRSPMTMADAPSRSAAARICSSASP